VKKRRKQRASSSSQPAHPELDGGGYNSSFNNQQQPPNQVQLSGWEKGSPIQNPIYEVPGSVPAPPAQIPMEKFLREKEKEKWMSHEVYEVPG
jgi:hypothetical protein